MEPGMIDPKEKAAAFFANLIMQQANAALMFMGKVKNPESGETVKDLEASRYFIDLIEMLEVKTKGNLSPEEEALLKQTLTTVRMAFVEAAGEKGSPAPASPAAGPAQTEPKPSGPTSPESAAASTTEDADARKKFVKKY